MNNNSKFHLNNIKNVWKMKDASSENIPENEEVT